MEQVPEEFQEAHFGILTSGSTGNPRLMVGSKERARELTKAIHTAQNCDLVSQTIGLLPLSYAYAFVNQWLWAHVMSRNFVKTNGFSTPDLLYTALRNAESAMTCLVKSQLPLFSKYFEKEQFPGVLRVNFAGEQFPQDQLAQVYSLFPNAQVFNNYGCTEAMPRLTVRRAEESDDASNIGRPLPGVELKTDAEGHLLFRSPYSAVASVGVDGVHVFGDDEWIATGDIGEQNADGSWRVTGRANEVFKRYGEKVSIVSVVGDLRRAWPGEMVGYACDDADGEPGWALVVSPEPDKLQVRELLHLMREGYTRARWPIRIESLNSIPRLPGGKVDLVRVRQDENKKLHWRQRI